MNRFRGLRPSGHFCNFETDLDAAELTDLLNEGSVLVSELITEKGGPGERVIKARRDLIISKGAFAEIAAPNVRFVEAR